MTGEELVDEIQALTGRTGDTALCDDTRATRWLNEAQRDIAERCPGLLATNFKNTVSVDTTVQLSYPLTDWTVGDDTSQNTCHVLGMWYLDGNESRKLVYTHVDEFDSEWPDPTHTDVAKDRPNRFTRRGNSVELFPLCLTAYCDKDLRLDGNYYPEDFTTNDGDESDLSQADEGMIFFGVAKAWGAIGDEAKAAIWEGKYEKWLRDYQDKNDSIHAWGGGWHEDALE